MDAKLFFLFALFAAVFVHENNALLSIPTLEEVKASVDLATAELVADAQEQTIKATTAADLLISEIEAFAINKTEDAKAEAAKIMNALQVQIEDEVTKQQGVLEKLQGCAEEHQIEIEDFSNATITSITGCVTEKVQTAINIVISIASCSKKITYIVSNLKSDLVSACPDPTIVTTFNSISQKLCELKVVGIATARVSELSVIISANIAEASAFIGNLATLQVDLPACFALRVAKAGVSSLALVATIVKCIIAA